MTSESSAELADGRFLGLLRGAALFALVAGAVGSVGLMLRAGPHAPRVLLAPFVIWVLSPFMVLAWAHLAAKRWSLPTRAALCCATLVITLGSLASYSRPAVKPAGTANAFVFVAVAPASWLLIAIVLPLAALVSGTLSRRNDGGRPLE